MTIKAILESYSSRLLPLVEWEPTPRGNVRVLNETADFYRYPDLTPQTQTVREDLPKETSPRHRAIRSGDGQAQLAAASWEPRRLAGWALSRSCAHPLPRSRWRHLDAVVFLQRRRPAVFFNASRSSSPALGWRGLGFWMEYSIVDHALMKRADTHTQLLLRMRLTPRSQSKPSPCHERSEAVLPAKQRPTARAVSNSNRPSHSPLCRVVAASDSANERDGVHFN